MLNLILDTNIFRGDINRTKAAFKTLEPLLKKSVIKLHIPFFVENEYKSFLSEECEENISKIVQGMNWLVRVKCLTQNDKSRIIDGELNLQKIITSLQYSFRAWIKDVSALTYDLNHSICQKVIASYFAGTPPSNRKRDRENIPDSFIYQEIATMQNKYGEIHIVSTDGKFRNSCKSHLNNIHVYPTLDDFVTSDACTQFIKINENEKPSLITFISGNTETISSELSPKTVDFLTWKSVHTTFKPDEHESATITGVTEPETFTFDIDEATYYGGGIILVPCTFQTEVTVDALIYKPDYDATKNGMHIEEHNEYYYSCEHDIEILVEGSARLEFDISNLNDIELINCDIDSVEHIHIL